MHGRGFGWWRTITLVLAVLILTAHSAGCSDTRDTGMGGASSAATDRPAEVLSWRHEILSKEAYAKLAEEWEAYAGRHPKDARAFVEWGDALRYSGEHEKAKKKYVEAYRIDPSNAAAITAHTCNTLIYKADDADWDHAHSEHQRAVELDPDYPDTYYTFWMTALHAGDHELADNCLRRMVETGDMPPVLLDYGYNMLIGAPENAIIFTNGDNDTYPPLACQAIMGLRPDVTIVNLSLLNTRWYIRHQRAAGVPIGLDDRAIDELKGTKDDPISSRMQHHIFERLSETGWPRPLCYAVTVAPNNRVLPATLVMKGLIERIRPTAGAEGGEKEFDLDRTRELLTTAYRLDSIVDPFFDWEHEGAIRRLGSRNYIALFEKVGEGLRSQSPPGDYGPFFYRAVQIATFHGVMEELVQGILEAWEEDDPSSSLLSKAKALAK
jgi:hypothetical protein